MTEDKTKTRSSRYHQEIEIEDAEDIERTLSHKQIKDIPQDNKTTKQDHPLLKKVILFFLIIIITIAAYSTLIEPKMIIIKEYKVESNKLPESFHGIKIAHISDIHYGTTINKKQLIKIVKKINDLNPDIVVFTGNLLDTNIEMTETTKEDITSVLKNIKCSMYKYAIYGKEDLDNKEFNNIIEEANFTLLDNKTTPIYYKGTIPILLTGYNPIISEPSYSMSLDSDEDATNYYKIVLTHEPDSIDNFIQHSPDLVLSGHSLGGIVDFKITKPLFLQEHSKKYFEDYQKLQNTELFISNGLGTNSLNMRLFNPPSFNLYRLYKSN